MITFACGVPQGVMQHVPSDQHVTPKIINMLVHGTVPIVSSYPNTIIIKLAHHYHHHS